MSRGAILLDRDGTLIVERHYLSDPALVELETGAIDGLHKLSEAGWPLVVLTNQSGIGRGYFDRSVVDAVNTAVHEKLSLNGIFIAGWYVCPHGPEDGCTCRKPLPGLALEAAEMLEIDLDASWMIGDKLSDVGLAQAIGARGILVQTGQAAFQDEGPARISGAWIASNLDEAADLILSQEPV